MLSLPLITANLQTDFTGREIKYLPKVTSTNTKALELLEAGAKEGTVVLTDNQTAGRGRHGHYWYSGAGKGLAFSIILTPHIVFESASLISLMAGLAVGEAIKKFQLTPRLKWPNDIILSGKKCGGILVETRLQDKMMTSAIVGIGINVNETSTDFPEAIRSDTTSIALEKGTSVQRELTLAWTLNAIERWYLVLKSGKINSIISACENLCAHFGKTVSFTRKGKKIFGVFEGITENGEAIIRFPNDTGKLKLSSQEISIIREK